VSALAPRVVLAEADTPTRTGMRLVLERRGFAVVGEVRDVSGAIETVSGQGPDAALLATDLPGGGIQAARAIGRRLPGTRIVMLTPRQDGEELVAAVLAGATAYLAKDMSPERLASVLERVLAGEVALPRRYTGHVLEALRGRESRRASILGRARHLVTDRQWEILQLLGDGRSTAEMAQRLGISEITARRHISSVLPKLGLKDRQGAVELMRDRSSE